MTGIPEKYHDTFQDNLKKLIETKLEGGTVQDVEKPKKLAPVVDLMAALKESLENAKKPAASEKRVEREAAPRQKKRHEVEVLLVVRSSLLLFPWSICSTTQVSAEKDGREPGAPPPFVVAGRARTDAFFSSIRQRRIANDESRSPHFPFTPPFPLQ